MRVAIVANSSWNIVNYRINIIRALQGNSHDVTVIAPIDQYSTKVESLGVKYVPIKINPKGINPIRELVTFYRLFMEYRRCNPDLIFQYTIKPTLYGGIAASLLNIPYVTTVTGLGSTFIAENWLTKILCILYRVSQLRARKVIFQNQDDRYYFISRKLISEAKSTIVPGSGIDLNIFNVVELPVRKKTGAKIDMVILMISRLLWDKGVLEYVEASRLVRQVYPNIRFQLLGEFEEDVRTGIPKNKLKYWIEAGHIEYLGSGHDVRKYIERSDCVVLPSYREGLPRVLLEAGAMGRPVVSTNVPGSREVVDEMVNGLLCNPKDPESLSQAIIRYIELPFTKKIEMALASRRKVENVYDSEIVSKLYMTYVN